MKDGTPSTKPPKRQQPKKPKRRVRVEIEYEDENDALVEEEGVAAGGAGLAWYLWWKCKIEVEENLLLKLLY